MNTVEAVINNIDATSRFFSFILIEYNSKKILEATIKAITISDKLMKITVTVDVTGNKP